MKSQLLAFISTAANSAPIFAGLISILLTSFGNDTFYRTDVQTFERLRDLIHSLPVDFVCKAGVYARTVFGMRSITHVLAGEVAQRLSGSAIGAAFFDKIVYRVDDMSEILAYYKSMTANQQLQPPVKPLPTEPKARNKAKIAQLANAYGKTFFRLPNAMKSGSLCIII